MKAVIRTDSSSKIGSGHLMRCLTLAEALKKRGADVHFICRDFPGNFISHVSDKNHAITVLPNSAKISGDDLVHSSWLEDTQEGDAKLTLDVLQEIGSVDLLVVDHYALDARWESVFRSVVKKIFVIDDLADRQHSCDVLLDQNKFGDVAVSAYSSLLPKQCTKLIGPNFALLSPGYLEQRLQLKRSYDNVKQVLVFLGGSDPEGVVLKVMNALNSILPQRNVTCNVVVNAESSYYPAAKMLAQQVSGFIVSSWVNMPIAMVRADLFVGASGSTTWERCCLGLPGVALGLAFNQHGIGEAVEKAGAQIYLGAAEHVDEGDIVRAVELFLNDPALTKRTGELAANLVDGVGTERVVNALFEVLK